MNMKKKSLVAGLLAVSLAAQPVAATIAPKAVHASDANELGTISGMTKEIDDIVKAYKAGTITNEQIRKADEAFNKFTNVQQSIIKADVAEGTFEIYELIVKEWKDSNVATEKQLMEAANFATKLRKAAKEDKTYDNSVAKELYNEYNGLDEKIVKAKVKEFVKFNEDGKPVFVVAKEGETNTEDWVNNLVSNIEGQIKDEIKNLSTSGSLKEIEDFINEYTNDDKDKDGYKLYGKDVRTKDVAEKIVFKSEGKGELQKRVEKLGNVVLPVYQLEAEKFVNDDGTTSTKTKSISEYEDYLSRFNEIDGLLRLEKAIEVKYYGAETASLDFNPKFDVTVPVTEMKGHLETLKEEVETFENKAKEIINSGNKAKALDKLRKYEELKGTELGKYNSIDKDLIAKLNAIVEGKPVAPVKETYYSLGVNVRDAEENLLGRLDRGFVIENAVLKEDNYIHFTYEGKEARAHINFVSKEKPLAAFYSKGGNVRETPDTKGLKLGYLPVNQIVLGEVTEKGVWVEIEFNGRKAFIANNRLSKEAVEVRYTSVGANVRNAAGEKVGYYKAGEVFKGVKEGNRIKVDYKGAVGYVHVAFVK